MFASKAGYHEHCQNLFFCPAWTSHSHSHSLSPSLTLSLPSYCVCCFMEGLDAVQIAVANRDCLSSPPVARHSIHKQITPARETLSCYRTTTSRTRSVRFPPLSSLPFLFQTSLYCFLLNSLSQDPPSSPSPTHSYSSLSRAGPLTPSSVWICQWSGLCVCVCAHVSIGNTSF